MRVAPEVDADPARLPIDGDAKGCDIGTAKRLQGHTTGQFSTEGEIEGIVAESLRLPGKVVAAKTVERADRVLLREFVIVTDCRLSWCYCQRCLDQRNSVFRRSQLAVIEPRARRSICHLQSGGITILRSETPR